MTWNESASVASHQPHFPLTSQPRRSRLAFDELEEKGSADLLRDARTDQTRTGFGGSPGTGLSSSTRFSLPVSGPGRGGKSLRTAAGDGGNGRPSRNAVTIASTSLPSSTSFSSNRDAIAWSKGR